MNLFAIITSLFLGNSQLVNPVPMVINGKSVVRHIVDGKVRYTPFGGGYCDGCGPYFDYHTAKYIVPPSASSQITVSNYASSDGACYNSQQQCYQSWSCHVALSIDFTVNIPNGWLAGVFCEDPFVFIGWLNNGQNVWIFDYYPQCGNEDVIYIDVIFYDGNDYVGVHSIALKTGCEVCVPH